MPYINGNEVLGAISTVISDGSITYEKLAQALQAVINGKVDKTTTISGTALDHNITKDELRNMIGLTGLTYNAAGLVRISTDGAGGLKVNNSNQLLLIQNASIAEVDAKTSAYKPITPQRIDRASKVTAHQDMSDSYDPSVLPYGDQQPVSYFAAKNYIDQRIMSLRQELIELING